MTLPVCYRSQDIQSSESKGVLEGVILRGQFDSSIIRLRKEIRQGNISNSTLITLIIDDLNHGINTRAKEYLGLLKQGESDSKLVKKIEAIFEQYIRRIHQWRESV